MSDLKKAYKTVMDDHFPEDMTISFGTQVLKYKKRTWKIADEKSGDVVEKGLRYGENPGQEAALYELSEGNLTLGGCEFIVPGKGLVSSLSEREMLRFGKHPGKTNLTDIDNALNIIKYLSHKPAVTIMKHNNPCGVACAASISEAYDKANMADRIAAFGGAVVLNRPVDKATAELISKNYLEVVAAPEFEEGTIEILQKRKNLRICRIPNMGKLSDYSNFRFVDFKSLMDGGIVVQQSPLNRVRTAGDFYPAETTYKGKSYKINRAPLQKELDDMLFGWSVEQGVTSNSVIYVKDEVTVGIGTGEQDRVGVAEIAIHKAYTKYADRLCFMKHGVPFKELELEVEQGSKPASLIEEINCETEKNKAGLLGSIMVSDAFFPFRDGVGVGIRQGIAGIVQPGGSERDFESIEACNEANVTMVYTGQRAFKH